VDFETGAGQFLPDGNCAEYPGLMAFSALRDGETYARRASEIMSEEATWLVTLPEYLDPALVRNPDQ
jgi:hypothetical protein